MDILPATTEIRPSKFSFAALLALLVPLVFFSDALAAPCGLRRAANEAKFSPAPPLKISQPRASFRTPAPIPFENGQALITDHFRIIWGLDYNGADPQWANGAMPGVSLWVETLGAALEHSFASYRDLGFPAPYGSDAYYLDVYIGNTGLRVFSAESGTFQPVTVAENYFALTEIDRVNETSYFRFAADFAPYTSDELGVLQAVSAHELYHAVQRAYGYPWDAETAADGPIFIDDARWSREGWWVEATATWMEEEIYPEVDDYVSYVQTFLARPYQPLNSLTGSHEYGASLFAGYIRGLPDGLGIMDGTWTDAYPLGVEPALDKNLAAFGSPGLIPSLARFWSLAAHPENGWPDGALFKRSGSPLISRHLASLTETASPNTGELPGRFGATLFLVDKSILPSVAELRSDAETAAFTASLSMAGSPTAGQPFQAGRTALASLGDGLHYLSVVNTSPTPGGENFYLSLGKPDGEKSPGSGGCFLESLKR